MVRIMVKAPESLGPLEAVKDTYYRVTPKVWLQGWSHDARLLALYLLTCPHRATEGLYLLPLGYAATDIGWEEERLREPFAELITDGFAKYDAEARVVFVCKALAYQAPANKNGFISAARRLVKLPHTPLFADLLEAAREHCPPFAEALPQLLPERFADSLALALTPSLPPEEHTDTVSEAVAEPAPVDNSAASDDDEHGGSIDPEQEQELPAFPVALCGSIRRAGGSSALDAVLTDGSDLNLTARRYLATVSGLVDAILGHLPPAKLEEARERALRASFADAERTQPDNLAAYLTTSYKRATHLGDLIGDELAAELRKLGKTRKGRR